MTRPLRRPFLGIEPGNQWPVSAWPNVPNIGAIRNMGNAGGSYSYQIGMPTRWALYDDGTNARWDFNFGSHGGEPYFDWRWWDDFNWGTTFNGLTCSSSVGPLAASGQVWRLGFYVAFAPGTNTYPANIGCVWDEVDSGLSYLNTVTSIVFSSPSTQVSSDPHKPTRMSADMTVVAGSTARIVPGLYTDWGLKTASDECRIRVYRPFVRRLS